MDVWNLNMASLFPLYQINGGLMHIKVDYKFGDEWDEIGVLWLIEIQLPPITAKHKIPKLIKDPIFHIL